MLRRIERLFKDIGSKRFYLPEHSLQSIETPIISSRIIREAPLMPFMHQVIKYKVVCSDSLCFNHLEIRKLGFSLVAPGKLGEPGSVAQSFLLREVLHDINIAETKRNRHPHNEETYA